MKKALFISCLIIFTTSSGQNIEKINDIISSSSNLELKEYVNSAKNQGITFAEAEKIIKSQGASEAEIITFRKLWDDNQKTSLNESGNNLPLSPDSKISQKKIENMIPSNRFGNNFFNNADISETPQLFLATPSEYTLGPGDEIVINLYGSSENTYTVEVSREGDVKFDKLAPIYLSGLNMKEVKQRLKKRLSKIYTGLFSENKIEKVEIDVSTWNSYIPNNIDYY